MIPKPIKPVLLWTCVLVISVTPRVCMAWRISVNTCSSWVQKSIHEKTNTASTYLTTAAAPMLSLRWKIPITSLTWAITTLKVHSIVLLSSSWSHFLIQAAQNAKFVLSIRNTRKTSNPICGARSNSKKVFAVHRTLTRSLVPETSKHCGTSHEIWAWIFALSCSSFTKSTTVPI